MVQRMQKGQTASLTLQHQLHDSGQCYLFVVLCQGGSDHENQSSVYGCIHRLHPSVQSRALLLGDIWRIMQRPDRKTNRF
jgi:hypothetical protein